MTKPSCAPSSAQIRIFPVKQATATTTTTTTIVSLYIEYELANLDRMANPLKNIGKKHSLVVMRREISTATATAIGTIILTL